VGLAGQVGRRGRRACVRRRALGLDEGERFSGGINHYSDADNHNMNASTITNHKWSAVSLWPAVFFCFNKNRKVTSVIEKSGWVSTVIENSG
jgi:hypothetical protein